MQRVLRSCIVEVFRVCIVGITGFGWGKYNIPHKGTRSLWLSRRFGVAMSLEPGFRIETRSRSLAVGSLQMWAENVDLQV